MNRNIVIATSYSYVPYDFLLRNGTPLAFLLTGTKAHGAYGSRGGFPLFTNEHSTSPPDQTQLGNKHELDWYS